MTMTFTQYDEQVEQIKNIPNNKKGWYPSVLEIEDKLLADLSDDTIMYFLWLIETAGSPTTPESAYGQKIIRQLLRKNIDLIDGEEHDNE